MILISLKALSYPDRRNLQIGRLSKNILACYRLPIILHDLGVQPRLHHSDHPKCKLSLALLVRGCEGVYWKPSLENGMATTVYESYDYSWTRERWMRNRFFLLSQVAIPSLADLFQDLKSRHDGGKRSSTTVICPFDGFLDQHPGGA
jgi:hypothetical protein